MLAAADLSRIATIFDAAEEQAGNRDETTARFDLLISLLRDMVRCCAAPDPAISLNRQLCGRTGRGSDPLRPGAVMELLELALDTRQAVRGNINIPSWPGAFSTALRRFESH